MHNFISLIKQKFFCNEHIISCVIYNIALGVLCIMVLIALFMLAAITFNAISDTNNRIAMYSNDANAFVISDPYVNCKLQVCDVPLTLDDLTILVPMDTTIINKSKKFYLIQR